MKQFSDAGVQRVRSSVGFRKSSWSKVKVWMFIFPHTLKLSRKIVELMVERNCISQRPESSRNVKEWSCGRSVGNKNEVWVT